MVGGCIAIACEYLPQSKYPLYLIEKSHQAMAVERVKTKIASLEEGMFVADLDRPWHETPFPLQGFYIKSEADVKALARFCSFVFVDSQRSRVKKDYAAHAEGGPRAASGKSKGGSKKESNTLKLPPIAIKESAIYEIKAPLHKEATRVKRLHQKVQQSIRIVCESVLRGEPAPIEEIESVAVSMVVSVVRNPDALVWLAKMDDEDSFEYQHVVRASVWALVFARHLGLSKPLMKSLATGVLLSHVGKMSIDTSLRESVLSELSGKELEAYQQYVELGLEKLRENPELGDGVLSIIEFHAERHNGTGFPKGITGDRIPLLAKIAGLVDSYQTLITPRGEQLGLSPKAAVTELYEQRNILFQKDLVEKFIEAVGVFPTGTLVELSSNEVGIVSGHNSERRLLPTVIVVTDSEKQLLKTGRRLNLMEWNSEHASNEAIFIRKSLPKGALGIDENSYLLSGATSKWSIKHLVSNFS